MFFQFRWYLVFRIIFKWFSFPESCRIGNDQFACTVTDKTQRKLKMIKKLKAVVLISTIFLLSSIISADITITAGPYLQSPTQTSMTVMWMTDTNSTATVEYGIGDTLDKKAVATHAGQIDANTRIHRIKVTGLTLGCKYNYRVTSTEIQKYEPYKVTFGQTAVSETYSFTTLDANKPDCSFVVFNDIHSKVDNFKRRVELANANPYEMVFLNGDILQDPSTEKLIVDTLLKPASDLFATQIPFLFARGNPETRGAYSRKVKDYVDTPGGKYYFSFRHGPVYFVVLDGGEDKEDSHWEYSGLNDFDSYRDEQTEWLKREIQKKEFKAAPFRVVLTHIPLFGSGDAHGTLDCRKKWATLLNKGKVDLHISGHTHRPAVVNAVKGVHDYPVFIGGGPGDNFTVIRVQATEDMIDINMTDAEGKMIHAHQAKRKKKNIIEVIFDK